MSQHVSLAAIVPDSLIGKRLDQITAEMFPDFSRMRIKEWILASNVSVDGKIVNKPRVKLAGGEEVTIDAMIEEAISAVPQDIPLNIVFEDEYILVVNKPAGLVVHPGAGNPDGTLLNALLFYYPNIVNVPRAGIVHRLDKDTTGLMIVAKTVEAQTHLVASIQNREVTREYEAICVGTLIGGGSVDKPIGRHPTKRTHMAVNEFGKEAITHYRIAEKYRTSTRLRLRLETGRTHQIRVHMAHLGYSLIGDQVYGGRAKPPKDASVELTSALRGFKRQALHAAMLSLEHPITGEMMEWNAPVPNDMVELTECLREDTKLNPQLDY
ncbi:MAG: 23S rRNA pseudouridine1911/1915/1917 synthase [Phenylobacterium sp.]|jgi:23S rRNA pseudouridine1911/1915/1917 synthase